MNKKGMTLIESVVTIALLGVVFLLATPLIRNFGRVNDRVKTQKEIDAEFSVVNEFIQEKIRAAKRTTKINPFSNDLKYVNIYNEYFKGTDEDPEGSLLFASTNKTSEGNLGNVLVLEIPFLEEDDDSALGFDDKDNDSVRLESQFEIFAFVDGALKYKVMDYVTDDLGNFETLINNVDVYSDPITEDPLNKSSFKFDKGVVIYYIKLNISDNSDGNFRDSLRGAASTRIDISY